jgi:hypothetical protein
MKQWWPKRRRKHVELRAICNQRLSSSSIDALGLVGPSSYQSFFLLHCPPERRPVYKPSFLSFQKANAIERWPLKIQSSSCGPLLRHHSSSHGSMTPVTRSLNMHSSESPTYLVISIFIKYSQRGVSETEVNDSVRYAKKKLKTTTSSPHFNQNSQSWRKGSCWRGLFLKYQASSLLYRETGPHIWGTWLAPES